MATTLDTNDTDQVLRSSELRPHNILESEGDLEDRGWPTNNNNDINKDDNPIDKINLPDTLTHEQRKRIRDLLELNKDLFVIDNKQIGQTDVCKHNINTGDSKPLKQNARNVPYSQQQILIKEVDEMLSSNVIRPSSSPWSSPVVLIKKPDGTYRFAVDYRVLNEATLKDAGDVNFTQSIRTNHEKKSVVFVHLSERNLFNKKGKSHYTLY